jgi:thiol-disulfide isomerase/thioredoxin|tara:strand:- start:2738 stop:3217 length:480 start_codon:yes stop_codon:yes gene_type:complete
MFESLKSGTLQLFSKPKFLIVITISALFMGIALYVYTSYISPKLDPSFVPNREFVEKNEEKTASVYFFYTEWCPHSKKSKPIFEKVMRTFNGKSVNGTTLTFNLINGEKDDDKLLDFEGTHKVQIDGFPTIYLVNGDKVIEYDANPTEESLSEFLHTAL